MNISEISYHVLEFPLKSETAVAVGAHFRGYLKTNSDEAMPGTGAENKLSHAI